MLEYSTYELIKVKKKDRLFLLQKILSKFDRSKNKEKPLKNSS